jgi:hypothetical protein
LKTNRSLRSGNQVFFEEELDAVGERLQDAPRAGFVRADAVLHLGDDLALEPDHEHHGDEQQRERDDDLEQHDEHVAESTSTSIGSRANTVAGSWPLDSARR